MKGIKSKGNTLSNRGFFVLRPTTYLPALRLSACDAQAGERAGNLQSRNFSKGFTFIETLIAVTILSLALVGTLTIVSRSVQSSVFSRDQIVAFYLAQEAIELLQNERSTNVLQYGPSDWIRNFGPCTPGPCAVWTESNGDVTIRPTQFNACSGNSCQPLKFDGFLYHHDPLGGRPGGPSIFQRYVFIDRYSHGIGPAPYDEIAVSVTMLWNSGAVERTLTIRNNMLNWQE